MKTKAHGVTADCTRVRVYNEAAELLPERWVRASCRQRMRLLGSGRRLPARRDRSVDEIMVEDDLGRSRRVVPAPGT